MSNVLVALINASERAANVARACCGTTPQKDTLLVAEKCEGEANARFDQDFKTIADVLAQESAKTEIGLHCPHLYKYVRGEECSEINGVKIALLESTEQTAKLLSALVPFAAAKCLAEASHSRPNLSVCDSLPKDLPSINPADLGVWIDPIDATSEFISGVRGEASEGRGLPCVTVLIGAYLRSTGVPVAGVINQPFYNGGKGRIVWGLCYENTRKWGGTNLNVDSGYYTVLTSGAEKPEIVEKFKNSGFVVKCVAGAGHKLLKVVLGEAAIYILSQGTTYRWDTCAPHAILKAKGGELLCYKSKQPITYNDPKDASIQTYCNSGGIIAYNDPSVMDTICEILN